MVSSECLWCRESITRVYWRMFLPHVKEWGVCQTCESKLVTISGEICLKCGRQLSKLKAVYVRDDICIDCHRWMASELGSVLVHNRSFFEYNDFIKSVLSLYKFRGDAEAGKVFNNVFLREIRRGYNFVDGVIPIPLSIERQYERGFNQCELWLEKSPNKIVNCLIRTENEEKQSKKSRQERIVRTKEMFEVSDQVILNGKKILLIDDLYTTGSTIYQAAYSLKKKGASKVYSLTLCRS